MSVPGERSMENQLLLVRQECVIAGGGEALRDNDGAVHRIQLADPGKVQASVATFGDADFVF